MKKKDILVLSIGVFLTVIAWLVADIYHASTEQKVQTKIEVPTLDNYTISKDLLNVIRSKQE
ncbi:hypothetical protein M1328_01755 [Patescibacteria group bacterium]|nr:hypothetical protein [Patescibacteria group bacterium]